MSTLHSVAATSCVCSCSYCCNSGSVALVVVVVLVVVLVQGGPKKPVALCFCLYLRQLLTHFQNSFTSTFCGQSAITRLLHIPPHCKCISALPCEKSMKYAYIMIITNKHFGKIEKKTLQTNIAVNVLYDTKLCGFSTV